MVRCRNLAGVVLIAISALLAARPLVGAEAAPLQPLWPRVWEPSPDVTLRLRGRIDTDAIWVHQTPENIATFGELGNVVGLRRARVGIEGELGTDHRYVAEIDLASGYVVPRDVYLGYGDRRDYGEFELGHFREPFSLEGGTSARYLAFMERSPINLLDPARNWGLGHFAVSDDEVVALGGGVFYAGSGPSDLEDGPGNTVDFTARLTAAPVNEGNGRRLLHFGLAVSERVPENGIIVIKQQPRSSLLELEDSSTSVFVPNLRFIASSQQLLNLQCAAANGSFWTMTEWYGTWIDQDVGGVVFYHGCHVDCGYFLTGEHRNYDASNGTLGAVRVNRPFLRGAATEDRPCGWGAWELAARFAYLDFLDGDTPLDANGMPQGLRFPQATFGVNWYLSDRVRLMVNYVYDRPDDINTGSSTAETIATRLAVFW